MSYCSILRALGHDPTDRDAVSKHVEVIIVPVARWPRGGRAFEDQHHMRLSQIAKAAPKRNNAKIVPWITLITKR
jgi:hypothetical protein